MKRYSVYLSKEAQDDIDELADFIAYVLKSPITSKQYTQGLISEFVHLEKYYGEIRVTHQTAFKIFGSQL